MDSIKYTRKYNNWHYRCRTATAQLQTLSFIEPFNFLFILFVSFLVVIILLYGLIKSEKPLPFILFMQHQYSYWRALQNSYYRSEHVVISKWFVLLFPSIEHPCSLITCAQIGNFKTEGSFGPVFTLHEIVSSPWIYAKRHKFFHSRSVTITFNTLLLGWFKISAFLFTRNWKTHWHHLSDLFWK